MITPALSLLHHISRTALFACIFAVGSAASFASTLTLLSASGTLTLNTGPVNLLPMVAVAPPTFSPVAGTYTGAQSVTISTATPGATIRYTTDGSTPTETNGTVYVFPVNITTTTMLRAIACEAGAADSSIANGAFVITSSPSAMVKVIYDFTPAIYGGGNPIAGLTLGTDGDFYGITATEGGFNNDGAVFKITPSGSLTYLTTFDGTNGNSPSGGLVQGNDGNFYGTTKIAGGNGNGAVYMVTSSGTLTTLASFNTNSGSATVFGGPMIAGSDGNFYGTAYPVIGGISSGFVFKVTPGGTLTTLAAFNGTNGGTPNGLVQGTDGNFYGTTEWGGASNYGVVFKVTPAGVLTDLVSFTGTSGANPGANPQASSLVIGSDGNLYGTTTGGGNHSLGTIFKITPAGVLSTLYSFDSPSGGEGPNDLVLGSDGNFYGATTGNLYGTLYKITPGGIQTPLFFLDGSNGSGVESALVQGSDGDFYGTAQSGGLYRGGDVFQLIIPPSAASPVFSPAAGNYTAAQSVTISSTTSGATIRYTTDGSTPTETSGTVYTGAIGVNGTTSLSAIAYMAGISDSAVTTSVYTLSIPGVVSTPTFSPPSGTYTSNQLVTLSSATSGASIRYTTDGSTPTETSGAVYSDGFTVSANTSINAIAYESGQTDSIISTGNYNIRAGAPSFSATAGTYTSNRSVTITSTTSGASIAYTTDGSTPTEIGGTVTHGTLYSSPVTTGNYTVLGAIAFKTGMTDSLVTGGTYAVQAASPTFSPASGYYTTSQSVTISCTTTGASIACTTDGSTPTEIGGTVTHGTLYSGPILIKGSGNYVTVHIDAIAFENGLVDSGVATTYYNVVLPYASAPTFSPAGGTYTAAQTVTITSVTSSASIRYTTDGSIPSEVTGTLYSGPISIGTTATLSAIAYETGFADSTVATAAYTIAPPIPALTFSPSPGTYLSGLTGTSSVFINPMSFGITVRYTTDGSTPTETNGTIFSSPVSISSTTILKAIAYGTGFTDSPVTSGIYTITSSPAPIVNVIYDFIGSTDGIYPAAGLMQGRDGNFYGTTSGGGISGNIGYGTVFKTTSSGVHTTLVAFSGANGADSESTLLQGSDGNFYGTTEFGGSNTTGDVFKMTPEGVLTTLVSFSGPNGEFPFAAGLIQGNDGNFYGTTGPWGGSGNDGTVFQMTPTGVLTTLASFAGSNGSWPNSGVIQGSDGNFYGTTVDGGSYGFGTVFRMTPAGVLTTLVSFDAFTNGDQPSAGLVQGTDGNFYGTTSTGSITNGGTVFKVTPTGVLTTLASFNVTNGAFPQATLLQGGDGNFYGTTTIGGSGNFGTVFKMTTAGVLATLVSFDYANGYEPTGLVQGNDGYLYGTAKFGGAFGYGLIFQLILPQVTTPVFSPAAGTYTSAQTVTITSATSGTSIVFTTDGSTPTEVGGTVTHGTPYSNPVNISSTTTLKAIAFESGFTDSPVASGTYTINIPTPTTTPTPAPPASSGGGGAFDDWFLGFLAFAGLWRALTRANHKRQ